MPNSWPHDPPVGDYTPDRYERLVEAVTSSPIYRQMSAHINVAQLPNLLSTNGDRNDSLSCAVARLISLEAGDTHPSGPSFATIYRHPAWGKEFRVDGRAPTSGNATDPELDWLLRRLRPINTRNRLTHLILLSVIETQAAFLHSGAWSDLEPLNLTMLCRRLAECVLPPGLETLDVSLISRVARLHITTYKRGRPPPAPLVAQRTGCYEISPEGTDR